VPYQTWWNNPPRISGKTLGQYYRLDSESGSDVVMADQLCGQFYAQLLGLSDIVPSDCTTHGTKNHIRCLLLKFYNGQFGAANGVRPDGSPKTPTTSLEVWTGINFGLAAFLIQMGMKSEAFQLTQAVVQQIYENGLQFRTPEAITAAGTFVPVTTFALWQFGQFTAF